MNHYMYKRGTRVQVRRQKSIAPQFWNKTGTIVDIGYNNVDVKLDKETSILIIPRSKLIIIS